MPIFENALVTGASSGLGRAIALELGARGTRVWLAARREPELAELAREIEARGGRARVQPLDVRDPERLIEGVRAIECASGGLDLVLANAGVGRAAHASELELGAQLELIDVNVRGAIATLLAALPPMLQRGRGTLAGVSSLAGRRAMPGSGSYSASKAALSGFLETMRIDLGPCGLAVVDIRPGFVRTPMTAANRFTMPFLWEVERAARVSVDALERGRAVCAFPWQMRWLTSFARALPDPLWCALARRLPQARARAAALHGEG